MTNNPNLLFCIMICVLLLSAWDFSSAQTSTARHVYDSLYATASENGSVKIIVRLNTAFSPAGRLSRTAEATQRISIAKAQSDFIKSLAGHSVTDVKKYKNIPSLAMVVSSEALELLRSNPMVAAIEEDALSRPMLDTSVPLIGGDTAWGSGYTGSGWYVAILDSGVDSSHSMFAGGKVAVEACYSTTYGADAATTVCPNGQSSQTGAGAGTNCDTSVSGCQHGTHVAGIAAGASSSLGLYGVAKSANIIALQVFSKFANAGSCGSSSAPCALSYTSDQISGLDYVYSLRNTYNIASANMSLGGGAYTSNCDAINTTLKAAIDNLRSAGIATVIAAGNGSDKTAISTPGCISTAISVGAVNSGKSGTADTVDSYSNSASFLNLLAPGSWIKSAVPGGGTGSWQGTSMATPHVAGAWAVLKQAKSSATVSEVLSALTSTGKSITDSNGITKPRIKVDSAISTLTNSSTPTPTPTPTPTTGSLKVYIMPSGAANAGGSWSVDSDSNWYSSGYNMSGLSTGEHSVYFKTIDKYSSPSTQYVTVSADSTTTATGTYVSKLAALSSPAHGGRFASSEVTFTWNSAGASMYGLWIGSSTKTKDLYFNAAITGTSVTVTKLPTDGRVVYVRLFSKLGSKWSMDDSNEYTYYASNPSLATMSSPTNGETINGGTKTFTFDRKKIKSVALKIGSTPNGNDIYSVKLGAVSSATVSGLPFDGRTLYARLYSMINGEWVASAFNDYTFPMKQNTYFSYITSPKNGSTFTSSATTFSWKSTNADAYALMVGTSNGARDIYFQNQYTNTSVTVDGIPTDGRKIYVRLYTRAKGQWNVNWYNGYVYTATGSSGKDNSATIHPESNEIPD